MEKNRKWIEALEQGVDQLDEKMKLSVMKSAGKACASDIKTLCEEYSGKKISNLEDLVIGWNILRENRGLKGGWEITGTTIRGVFGECGCPLIRSGMANLHPTHCYCSQGMMESIFGEITGKAVEVEIKKSIGRGDDVCHFLIRV